MERMIRFRSLQQKLAFYAFVLSFLALSTVGFLSYRVARDQVQRDREELMEMLAGHIAQDLEIELKNAARDIRLWASVDFVRSSLDNRQPELVRLYLDDLARHHPMYDVIFTVDLEGRISAANTIAAHEAGRPFEQLFPEVPPGLLQEALNSPSVHGIGWRKCSRINELHGREPGHTPREFFYQIALAAPVEGRAEARRVGVIIAVLNWSHFQQVLDSAQKAFRRLGLTSGYAFLDASDGNTIIGHKYRELYGTRTFDDHHLPTLHDRLKINPTGTLHYKWREGPKIAALARVNPMELDSQFDWRLGVGINEPDIFAPVQALLSWFLMISLAVAFSIVVVTMFLGRTLTVSLNEFSQLARDAAHGRFSQLARARTDDELGSLAQAFNEMVVAFRAQMPFAKIPNPYVVGNPIRTPEMFFGRQEDLEWIGSRLENAGNKMILLYGQRRIGKTSLLHQVLAGRASIRALPFFFDTQQIIPELAQDSDFYHVVAREMLAQVPAVQPGLKAPFIAAERFTPETLRKLLQFLQEVAPERIPVLLFDELENLEYKLARGVLTSDLFLFFAGLMDGNTPVSFVTTGSDRLEKLKVPDWNILVPKTVPRHIGLLTPNDARRLILEPVRGFVLYDDGIPGRILRLTAGHPYYTQVICQALVDHLNQKHDFAAGPAELDEALKIVLDNPPPPLNHVWESLANVEKIAAAGLAHAIADEGSYADIEGLRRDLPSELGAEAGDRVALHSALGNLALEEWVEASGAGEYRFRIDLLRLWLRREHSVWHVADEFMRSPRS